MAKEKKLLFIVNPKAGKTAIKSKMNDILEIFCGAGYRVEVYLTHKEQEVDNEFIVDHADEYDIVVCAGGDGTLDNTVGSWETPMILTIYGPAVNPTLSIGGNTYKLNTTLAANERAIIDQLHKKIYKIGTTGGRSNLFNVRDKTNDIFRPAPVGMVPVLYNGDYSFDITLVHQRSEPLWND